jgi:hypothetical protein
LVQRHSTADFVILAVLQPRTGPKPQRHVLSIANSDECRIVGGVYGPCPARPPGLKSGRCVVRNADAQAGRVHLDHDLEGLNVFRKDQGCR